MSGSRILIAEDESALSKVLKLMLEMEGFSVRVAADGAEAMELMRDERPDLLLCDLMMPGMNGYQVCEAIKQDPSSSRSRSSS